MRTLTLLALAAVGCAGQVCAPSPDIKIAIDEIAKQPPAERSKAARALRDKYPEDIWVQRVYASRATSRDALIAEYEKALADHPEDAHYLYYRGTSLIGTHTLDAIQYLDEALEKDPALAAVHARLVTIYASPNFKSAEKLQTHLAAFLKACPDSDLRIYSNLERMDAPDLVRESAVNLRKALAAREDVNDLTSYTIL
jgi:hypothetical protein